MMTTTTSTTITTKSKQTTSVPEPGLPEGDVQDVKDALKIVNNNQLKKGAIKFQDNIGFKSGETKNWKEIIQQPAKIKLDLIDTTALRENADEKCIWLMVNVDLPERPVAPSENR